MATKEHKLKVEDFEQFLGALAAFDTTLEASCCQATITKKETTMFNKWLSGKSDLFTTAIHLDDSDDGIDSTTIFIPDIKKFLMVLKNIGKYYDIKDMENTFNNGKVKLSVGEGASHVRISSPKYSIKFQLATSAVVASKLVNVEKLSTSSKYGAVMHSAPSKEDVQQNFLLTVNMPAGKLGEVNEMLSALADGSDASIKLQIPEQVAVEGEDLGVECIPNTLYATISDNGKLVKSSIGNKVSIEFGKMTYAAEDYKDRCASKTTFDNFVFNLAKNVLDVLNATCRTFVSSSKAKDIELVISQPNMLHMNMEMLSGSAKSEIYVTVVGLKPQQGL